MCESSDNFAMLDFIRSGTVFGMGDDFGKIFRFAVFARRNMFPTGESGRVGGVDTVSVVGSFKRRHDTVGCEQDRSVEILKLFPLFPPGVAVVTYKMFVFFECWIVVGRQHLAMCVDIDPGPFGLGKQFFHVFQVVSADQDGWIVAYADVDVRYFRVAVAAGVGFIEQCHSFDSETPGFQNKSGELFGSKVFA